MTQVRRSVRDLLGSFVSEERAGRPGQALAVASRAAETDPGQRDAHLIDAAIAALLGGEPKRALRLLDQAHADGDVPARMDALLRLWAWQLDVNCYPGGVGAELQGGDLPPVIQPATGTGDIAVLEHVVAYGPPALSTVRTLVESTIRAGSPDYAERHVAAAATKLEQLAGSLDSQSPGSAAWAHLAGADLLHRAGSPHAAEVWSTVSAAAREPGRAEILALVHLLEGDHLLTPASSPESLGFHLAPESQPAPPRPVPDPARAQACYDAAEVALESGDAPRLAAALHMRQAMVLGLRARIDHDRRRDLLRQAVTLYEQSGDAMGAHLAAGHLLLADVDAGDIHTHALDLGAGWRTPDEGPVARALSWAAGDGSTSWCVGLGRLFERSAQAWAERAEFNRARVAYLAGLPLVQLNPSLPSRSIVVELADLDSNTNLASRAMIRLERLAVDEAGRGSALDGAQRVQAAWVTVAAQRARARGANSGYAALGMLRLRDEMVTLASGPASPPGHVLAESTTDDELAAVLSGFDEASAAFASVVVAMAGEVVTTLDALVPLARADHAERTGRQDDASQWHAEAIARAAAPGTQPHLLPVALIAAERFDEARKVLRNAVATGTLPDEFVLPLSIRARDYTLAREAADRLDATTDHSSDWSELLARAELLRAEGRVPEAAEAAARAVDGFELVVAPLLRDPDRLAACDQPDVSALYLTWAVLRHQLGDADGSCAAFERSRALSWGAAVESTADAALWGAWQRAAAEWGISADRALVQIDRQEGGLTPALIAQLDGADDRLARAEHDLERADPGVLLRRSSPPPLRLQSLRERLGDDTIVLEYATMGDDLVGWAVTSDGTTVAHHTRPYRQVAALVRRFHRSCAGGRADDDEPFRDLLLAPFTDELDAHTRVVVVPFGPLSLLPFQALTRGGVPLGVSHVVSYAPAAATVGRAGPLDQPLVPVAPLVVGDPAFTEILRPQLRRLAGAEVEARVVAARTGAPRDRVLVGEKATETDVTSLLRSADLFHIATHGLLDDLAPFASSLVLAGAEELTVADLVGLKLTTPLAVLSGCDTGRGTATLGGDVVGLTRSLLRSGVRQAVVSLWPVDDRVAPVVMDEFYRRLVGGRPPAQALAEAQQALRGLSADDLESAYLALGGAQDVGTGARRRSAADLLLDPELRDDEPLPEPLDGTAERYWAPYVIVAT